MATKATADLINLTWSPPPCCTPTVRGQCPQEAGLSYSATLTGPCSRLA